MIEYTHVIASIDPDHPVPLAGRAGEARITNHVHDSLEANILAMFDAGACNAVFISIDAVFVGRELSDALLEACAGFGVNDTCFMLLIAMPASKRPGLRVLRGSLLVGYVCADTMVGTTVVASSRMKPRIIHIEVYSRGRDVGRFTLGRAATASAS